MTGSVTPKRIVDILRTARLRASSEAQLQLSIAERLNQFEGDFSYKREVILSPKDRPDFIVDGGIVIEAKTKCARRTIWRQIARYAEHECVTALILVTGTALGVPPTASGKPIFYVSRGRTFL